MRFTIAYSACQVCSPSRAAIQTGRAPARLKITDYIGAPQPNSGNEIPSCCPAHYAMQLPLEETTIAEKLRENGYRTFFAGKWHLGSEGHLPTDQGYEVNRVAMRLVRHPALFLTLQESATRGWADWRIPSMEACEETAKFIQETPMIPLSSPCSPSIRSTLLWKPPKHSGRSIKRKPCSKVSPLDGIDSCWIAPWKCGRPKIIQIYAGMMESLDDAVGRVMRSLKEAGKKSEPWSSLLRITAVFLLGMPLLQAAFPCEVGKGGNGKEGFAGHFTSIGLA